MKFRAGIVLPMIMLALAPAAASAQQAQSVLFVADEVSAPATRLSLLQDPPSQKPEDVMATSGMFLGIVGSFVGGLIAWAFGFRPEEGPFAGAGWIMSIVGALIVVWIGLFVSSRTGPTSMRPR